MKSFYTMFDDITNVHLIKDVGMIPYTLAKEHLYDSYIVSYGRGEDEFPYLKKDVRELKLVARPRITGNTIIDGCIWLIKNAKKIDVLNLYHYSQSTFIWILFYKLANRNGEIYLKLDMCTEAGMKMKMKEGTIKYWLTKNVLGKCKLISAETKAFKEFANQKWPIKTEYISNGVQKISNIQTMQKEKIILSVGRLGTKQKATEILLNAFEKALPYISSDWNLILVGSMEKDFEKVFKEKILNNQELKSRIHWLDEIAEREQLKEIYQKAAIFTMPSRWEGFSIAGIEALSNCDYLLTTELMSFCEMINNKYGMTFPVDDIEKYSELLVLTCKAFDSGEIKMDEEEIEDYINENYCYEESCKKIYRFMERAV